MCLILQSASQQVQLLAQPWMVRKLPPDVLQRGPWKIVGRRDETRLKLHYRRALAREGYCAIDAEALLYRPDQVLQDCH